MKIEVLGSGSSGNCYFVSDGNTSVFLDAGLTYKQISEWLWIRGHKLSDIDACLVTHCHGDHVKSAQRLADRGVDVYTSQGTIDAAGLTGSRIHRIGDFTKNGDAAYICGVMVYAFEVEHDAPGTMAFLLAGKSERLLYITDAEYFPYALPHVSYIMIECNNDPGIMLNYAQSGEINPQHLKRVAKNHMSIETVLTTLSRLDRTYLKEVWLLHLSDGNSNEEDFKRRVQELTGCEVYVA